VGEQAESMVALTWVTHQSEWRDAAVVRSLREEIPELEHAHPELENQVLGHRDCRTLLPNAYSSLGQVLA
jgi:hypothetical protein